MKDERLALKEAWLDLNDETVCGVRDGEDRLVVRRETLDDLVRLDVL